MSLNNMEPTPPNTPSNTPPNTPNCPDAPKKQKVVCEGCKLLFAGLGGENQMAHIGKNGCLGELE